MHSVYYTTFSRHPTSLYTVSIHLGRASNDHGRVSADLDIIFLLSGISRCVKKGEAEGGSWISSVDSAQVLSRVRSQLYQRKNE